jgi:hypothetical protein
LVLALEYKLPTVSPLYHLSPSLLTLVQRVFRPFKWSNVLIFQNLLAAVTEKEAFPIMRLSYELSSFFPAILWVIFAFEVYVLGILGSEWMVQPFFLGLRPPPSNFPSHSPILIPLHVITSVSQLAPALG